MRLPRFHRLRGRLSYANVMATLAFFFALTGGAMAGVKYISANDPIPSPSDLAGSTYGNPVIAAGKVTSAKIADGAITSSKFDSSSLAPNADKLDGLDSTAFLSGYQVVEETFSSNYSSDSDISTGGTTVGCPSGEVVVGGGGFATWSNASDPSNLTQTDVSSPVRSGQKFNEWTFIASKPDGSTFKAGEGISGSGYAICVNASS